jgi:serine phosphatase RsbU (regulator of sigma subunit)/anti-sigma regulatory factor (Ser/Thr protein kinase)
VTSQLQAVRAWLPAGGRLPEDVWRTRHRGILAALWAHAVVIPVFALIRGYPVRHVLAESAIVPAAAVLATVPSLPRRLRVAAASVGLLSSSAVLVHLSGGMIEMHFHFFVMVAVVALYQDWLPFLASIGYVLVHHGLIGALDPSSVYNHPAAWSNPWKWAAIHAFFIAGISAACLLNWRLNETALAERRQAEDRLRDESRVVESVNDLGQALAAEHDVAGVVRRVTDAATGMTHAELGAFFYNVQDAAGESYMLHTISGAPDEAFSGFPMPRNTGIFAPTFAGTAAVRLDDVTQDARYGKNPPYNGMPPGHLPVRSYLAVPVKAPSGEVLGGLFLGHGEPGRFTDTDERLVVGIAAHAAVALDNARLYESERRARESVEEAKRHLEVLADASRALASSLELSELLFRLVRAVSPTIADGSAIYVTGSDGWIHEVAAHGTSGLPAGLTPASVSSANDDHPIAQAIRTSTLQAVERGWPATDEWRADDSRRGGSPMAVVVPLVRRDRAVGALVMANSDPSRDIDLDDVALAEELARRAAVAIENAQLYASQRSVAETLQQSLLPESLPDIPGLATAARYLPGGRGIEVGGDWYDLFALPTGEVALAMGDVVGHGLPAASLMGQLRNALRAFALEGHAPALLMTRLNSLLAEFGTNDQMATLVFALYDPEQASLTVVNAGHPPPLLVSPNGAVAFLEQGEGVPLGAMSRPSYSQATVPFPPGALVLMYTDGLVETRDTPLEDRLAGLRRAVLDGPDALDGLCDHLLATSLAGRGNEDDVAVLAVRSLPLGARLALRMPTTPAVLGPLRATLRRWLAEGGVEDPEAFEILTAAGEACANAVQHGGLTATSFAVDAELGEEVRIEVSDDGRWREARPSGGGRGLDIMKQFMDEVALERTSRRTRVVMRRRLCVPKDREQSLR